VNEPFHNFLPHIASSETLHKSPQKEVEPYTGLSNVKKKVKHTGYNYSALTNIKINDDIGDIYSTDKRSNRALSPKI